MFCLNSTVGSGNKNLLSTLQLQFAIVSVTLDEGRLIPQVFLLGLPLGRSQREVMVHSCHLLLDKNLEKSIKKKIDKVRETEREREGDREESERERERKREAETESVEDSDRWKNRNKKISSEEETK